MEHTPHKMTGGELPEPMRSEMLRLRALIQAEEDVHAVHGLAKIAGEDRWLFFIQTPFATFPRFVIGSTDPANDRPELLLRCGAEWSAREAWTDLEEQYELEDLP